MSAEVGTDGFQQGSQSFDFDSTTLNSVNL
jgi:hypothetical protein